MIFSIFASIVIWGLIPVIAIRVFNTCGISLPENKVIFFLISDKRINITEKTSNKEIIYIFIACIAFRILIYILSAAPVALFSNSEHINFASWLSQWKQWDANGYNHMISGGYSEMVENGEYVTLVFFPLYAFIARIFNILINNTQISALITSTLCYAAACSIFYNLVAMDYGKNTAKKAVLYISVFPFGFFFGAMMTESTFFLTSVTALYFIRKHNWIMVGIFGALASLTRLAGIAIIFPAAVEFIEHYEIFGIFKNKQFKKAFYLIIKKGLWILLTFAGLCIFLYCNYALTGNCFKFLELDKQIWNQESCYLGKCILTIWREILSQRSVMIKAAVFIPGLLSIIFTLIMLLYGTRRNRNMYTTYLIVYLVMNISITWPMSVSRYISCAVPLFIFLADFAERHKTAHSLITVIFAVLFGIYMTGYLFSKQIM